MLLTKLQYGRDRDWNHHRHDAANLVHYVETKWAKDFPLGLDWQATDISKTSLDELLQSPVIFVSGSQAPEIDAGQAKMLREFTDRGGLIFAETSCPESAKFDLGFRAVVKEAFPSDELKPLAADHPIWSIEEAVPVENRPHLLGIERGGRTRLIYLPPPAANAPLPGLSGCWELSQNAAVAPLPAAVAAQIAIADSIGLNMLAYATHRKLKAKFELFPVKAIERRDRPRGGWGKAARRAPVAPRLRHASLCPSHPPRALGSIVRLIARGRLIGLRPNLRRGDSSGRSLIYGERDSSGTHAGGPGRCNAPAGRISRL